MRLFWLLILSCSLQPALSTQTVHRWVDSNGVVHFSDQIAAGSASETIEVNPPAPSSTPVTTITSSDSDMATAAQEPQAQPPYDITLQTPLESETLRENSGKVHFSVAISPPMTQPFQLQVLLDGAAVLRVPNQLAGDLENVDRGMHQIVIKLLDENGKILASTKETTFYLFRVSVLTQPNHQAKPKVGMN